MATFARVGPKAQPQAVGQLKVVIVDFSWDNAVDASPVVGFTPKKVGLQTIYGMILLGEANPGANYVIRPNYEPATGEVGIEAFAGGWYNAPGSGTWRVAFLGV